jgi:transcriptional regulator GlxA family with amidase domain
MDHRVKRVMELMEVNLHRRMGISELSRAVNLSPWRLCHLFKSEIGTPPLKYLKALRMERAKMLVSSTFLSIKEIMNTVGISDESHFVKDFRRAYGLTPSQYRILFFSPERLETMDSKISR